MAEFKLKTKRGASGHDKPRVYFTCHPNDFDLYFDRICNDIFSIKGVDCAIYYTEDMTAELDEKNLNDALKCMNLFVVPVTFRLMSEPNRAMQVDIAYAKEHNIPILPFMVDSDISDIYSNPDNFGNRQYIQPFSTNATEINYYDKLEKYLKFSLISGKTAKRVRAAFDAYVFLSYRKKDRQYANQLMRIIHNIPGCRDIAIWYDEFLTPGESFIKNIKKAMKKSKLFALLVTPNLLELVEHNGKVKPNFVMKVEYPAAKKWEMTILPTEMEKTDYDQLNLKFKGIPRPISSEDKDFVDALLGIVKDVAILENDSSPEHNFLIGLAYIDGIDVEINSHRGIELITGAAEAGLPEAMEKLFELYFIGSEDIPRDYEKSLAWADRLVDFYSENYDKHGKDLIRALNNLAHIYSVTHEYSKAAQVYQRVYDISCRVYKRSRKGMAKILNSLAYSYGELNDYEQSLKCLMELYDIQLKLVGEGGIITISTLHNIAFALFKLGKYEESRDLFIKVYNARKDQLGEGDPNTLESLNNLSVIYGKLDQHEIALKIKCHVYDMRCRLLGERHPDTVRTLSNMAHTYSELGDYDMAIEVAQRAWEIRKVILGEEHPSTVTTMNILAVAYGRMGQLEKALELHDSVYNIRKRILGEENYKTILAKKNLDHILRELGFIF